MGTLAVHLAISLTVLSHSKTLELSKSSNQQFCRRVLLFCCKFSSDPTRPISRELLLSVPNWVMAHMHARQPAYLFEDDAPSSETSSSGTTALSPADAIKQAIHALQAFHTTKNRDYINEAVELAQHAADSTPSGDENLARYLTTLGAMHQHHYKAVGGKSSIDCAVVAARRAVEISRDDDDDRDLYIRNLSAALRYRYSESGDNKHLDEAVSTMK